MKRQMRYTFGTQLGKAFLTLVLALGVCAPAHAGGGDLLWAESLRASYYCQTVDIASDAQGNCYILGSYAGNVDFDPGPATENHTGWHNAFVVKLNAAGQFLWARTWDKVLALETRYLPSFAVDTAGNVCLGGWFVDTVDLDPGSGTAAFTTSYGNPSGFLLKLDSSGDFLWARNLGEHINAAYWQNGSLAVDADGNVYFGGYFSNATDFDPGPGTAILTPGVDQNNWGTFLMKLDAWGNFLWANSLNEISAGPLNVALLRLTTDAEGQVLVATGSFLRKFNALGNSLWAKGFEGLATGDFAILSDMCTDTHSNVYCVGYFIGTVDFDPGPGAMNLEAGPNSATSAFLMKLDASGNLSFVKWLNATGSYGDGVAVDADGNVIVAGTSSGTTYFDGLAILAPELNQPFVLKVNPSGNLLWAENLGQQVNHETCVGAVAVDANGDVYIARSFDTSADFDPGPGIAFLAALGLVDGAIVKLDGSSQITPPTPMVSSTASSPSRVTPIPVEVNFYALMTGFEASDLVVTNATVTNFAGIGSTYTFNLVPEGEGPVTVNIPAGVATGITGVANAAGAPFSLTYLYPDTDGDGLSDVAEASLGTNPALADSDGDHLSDGAETGWGGNPEVYTPGVDTDPLNPDTDGDGVSDGMESATGHDPLLQTDVPSLPLTPWGSVLMILLVGAAYAHRRIRAR